MNWKTERIRDKNRWEKLVTTFGEANFLQSWNWGLFEENLGKKVYRIGILENGHLIGGAQAIVERAKRGDYLTVAGGPLVDFHQPQMFRLMTEKLAQLAREEGCWFVRIRPQEPDNQETEKRLRQLGWYHAPMHLTADLTLNLDLSKGEDQLLKEMRKNTRYDVRQVEKKGLTVKTSDNPEEIDAFYRTQLELAEKHGFVPFSLPFLKEQFKAFVKDGQVKLFHSFQDGQLLASAFIIFYHHEAVYHYGVSTEANAKLPGTHAVLWAAILEAKKRGLRRFNFWGIAPEGETDHRFYGVSLFKRGFGGEELAYVPAHDLPLHPLYWVTRVFEFLRKKMRKL